MKNLVVQKKLEVWNEVVERANSDFEGNRKEFWAFVCRRTKGKRRGVTALRNSAGVSVTSTKGKLEVLKRHYQQLGVDTAFDDSWKGEVDKKVCEFSNLPTVCVENVLDREITVADRCHADFHSVCHSSICFPFHIPFLRSTFRVSHRGLFPMRGRVKCALRYNGCYTLGANWDRQGDPNLLPRPRKMAYEVTIVRHLLLRGRDCARDRGTS